MLAGAAAKERLDRLKSVLTDQFGDQRSSCANVARFRLGIFRVTLDHWLGGQNDDVRECPPRHPRRMIHRFAVGSCCSLAAESRAALRRCELLLPALIIRTSRSNRLRPPSRR